MAWSMANKDLLDMRDGLMDTDGQGMTNAGRICGLLATVLGLVGGLLLCLYFVLLPPSA
jgi:hypothetical protein